ncbi:MAG: protein kinase [Acidobacteria bacterium]|nr:protein kinase [Acidobacteriota bacterium]
MDRERWSRVDALFRQASSLPRDECARFLTDACEGDESLRAEVDSLLAFDGADDCHVRQAVRREALAVTGASLSIGDRIGPYRIAELLGQGGMGTVYRGIRDDHQFEMQVAIKVAGAGLAFPEQRMRFRQERQILANLDHPNIARLLDGGETADGLPYLVMELVSGEPVATYASKRGLNQAQRLALFLKICDAVAYAHRNLVAHRDLKPANLLITAGGAPKLLDFGIARLLASHEPGAAGALAFTPEYASPEQARGESVSTAADVYALGLLLFELMTGGKAQPMNTQSPAEIMNVVCERDLPKPPPGSMDTDIESIIRMAVRKDPAARYGAVEMLMDDIRRYQEGLPVRARQGTWTYRATRFARRHRVALAGAGLLVIAITAGVISTLVQAARAERRFLQVRSLARTVLFDLHDDIAALPGSTPAREKLVRTAMEYLDALSKDAGGNQGLRSELAGAYERVGDVLGLPSQPNLGYSAKALENYQKALALREQPGERPGATLAQALALNHYKLADLLVATGGTEPAKAHYQRGLTLMEQHPDVARALRQRGLASLGDLKIQSGDPRGALADYRSALQIVEAGPHTAIQQIAATARIGDALQETGDLQGALRSYEQVLSLRNATPPATDRIHGLILARHSLGNVLGNPLYLHLGRRKEAEQHYRAALEMSESLAAADPRNARAKNALAASCWRLGAVLEDPKEAIALHRRAIAAMNELLAASPGNTGQLRTQVFQQIAAGNTFRGARRFSESVQAFEEALRIGKSLSAMDPARAEFIHDLPIALLGLGQTHLESGAAAKAVENFREALRMAKQSAVEHRDDLSCNRYLAEAHERIGDWHTKAGNCVEAHVAYREAISVWDQWLARGVDNEFLRASRARLQQSTRRCAM